ncbi:MAG: heparinase II/III family protein, partial [Armatimonadota bacterium]
LCAGLGPLGAGHWPEDFSNFESYTYGQRLIPDMSTFSYTTSIWKNYFYSSLAHNVVLVDGLSQDRAADGSETLYTDEPRSDDWHSDAVFDLAWGEYDDRWVDYTEYTGWVNRFGAESAVHLATHRREFAFIKDSYWIISDRLKAEGEHEYSQLFHVEPNTEAAVFGRKSAGTVGEGIPTVRIIQADEVSAEVIVGREEPIQGWMATGHGTKQEAGCISFNQTAEDEAVFDTVLLPLQAGEQPDLTVERIPVTDTDGNTIPVAEICALKITTPEGTDLYINDLRQTAIGPANGKMKTAGALSTDARAAVIRLDGDGNVRSASAVGATVLEFNGQELSVAP